MIRRRPGSSKPITAADVHQFFDDIKNKCRGINDVVRRSSNVVRYGGDAVRYDSDAEIPCVFYLIRQLWFNMVAVSSASAILRSYHREPS
ncbi:unnamed protein product [Lathyrus oleraceus]